MEILLWSIGYVLVALVLYVIAMKETKKRPADDVLSFNEIKALNAFFCMIWPIAYPLGVLIVLFKLVDKNFVK